MQIKIYFIVAFIYCFTICCQADPHISLHHIDTKGNEIHAICSDSNGIIWLGTSSGLLSLPQLESNAPGAYDRPMEGVNKSLNIVSADRRGCLWIKNNDNDVFIYDPHNNIFTENVSSFLERMGIDICKEFSINTDLQGNPLLIKGNRILRILQEADRTTTETYIADDSISAISIAGTSLAALTAKGIFLFSLKSQKLTQTISLHGSHSETECMTLSPNCNIYIGSDTMLTAYNADSERGRKPSILPSSITSMAFDNKQQLWVATRASGIYIFDCEGLPVGHLRHHPADSGSLLSDQINTLYHDPLSGTMWIAYRKGGLSAWSNDNDYCLSHIISDSSGNGTRTDVLSFAPRKGVGMYIGLENRGIFLHHDNTDSLVYNGGSATALYSDVDSSLWIGMYQRGLLRRSPGQKDLLLFEGESPYAVTNGPGDYIYVSLLGKGIRRIDSKNGECMGSSLCRYFVLDLEYYGGKIYGATTEGLYSSTDGKVWRKVCDGSFRDVCIDNYGFIWLLGDEGREGLTLLDSIGTSVNIPEMLKSAHLKSIAADENGNVWIIGSNGLNLLLHENDNPGNISHYIFNINPGNNQVFYNYNAAAIDTDGTLWIGTTHGWLQVDIKRLIEQISIEPDPKPLVVGSISVNNNVLSPGETVDGRVILKSDVVFTRRLSLRHNENNIVIECSKPLRRDFVSDTYFYQVKGLSDMWYPMENMKIVLSGLPSGHYEVMTRTRSSEPSQLIVIDIAHPAWASGRAFLIYAIIAAIASVGFWHQLRKRRQHRMMLQSLKSQHERESQMNDLKFRFFTNISHDLRTPLSLIISPLEELIGKIKDPESNKMLKIAHRNAGQLKSMVAQILDFQRLESGGDDLHPVYDDIVWHLKNVCDSFMVKAEMECIRFSFVPSVEHAFTMFDSDKTSMIIMNLLSNAFKFTDKGGEITVRLDMDDSMIVVTVTDSGCGIPPGENDHIFDRFFTAGDSVGSKGGYGIGLHMVREYVRMHGGEISARNNDNGKGAQFRFTIPVCEHPEEKIIESEIGINPDSRPNVLLADDNADMLLFMRNALQGKYNTVTASDGEEALRQLKLHDIDLIISDVMMPAPDGFELCRIVKTDINTSHIPVILLTAKNLEKDEIEGLEAGADDYITKPFSMKVLRRRIKNLEERTAGKHRLFNGKIDVEPSEIAVISLDEQFIARAIDTVERHISEVDFSVEQMSEELGMHRAQLYKKLYHLTGKTPLQFIRVLRLKRGRQLLANSGQYVSEVAYKVGFNSPRVFSKYFKEEFGTTPRDFAGK